MALSNLTLRDVDPAIELGPRAFDGIAGDVDGRRMAMSCLYWENSGTGTAWPGLPGLLPLARS